MKPRTLLFFMVTWAFLATGLTRGQESAPAARPAVVFTVAGWDVFDPNADLVLNYEHKGKVRPVEIVWRARSPVLPCDGAGELVFTRTVSREGKQVEVPVATAVIPAGVTRALLVFGKNPSPGPGETAVRIMVIDDSYGVFPGQSVRVLNYSRVELGGSVGEQSFAVPPGGSQVVRAALPEANRLLPFRLAGRDANGGWKKLRSTSLSMTARLRVLVFLIDDSVNPGRPEMVLLRDNVEIEPQPPAQSRTLVKASGLRVNPGGR